MPGTAVPWLTWLRVWLSFSIKHGEREGGRSECIHAYQQRESACSAGLGGFPKRPGVGSETLIHARTNQFIRNMHRSPMHGASHVENGTLRKQRKGKSLTAQFTVIEALPGPSDRPYPGPDRPAGSPQRDDVAERERVEAKCRQPSRSMSQARSIQLWLY